MPSLSSFCAVEKPKAFFYDEGSDPTWACGSVRFRINHQNIGVRTIGDPHFVAV